MARTKLQASDLMKSLAMRCDTGGRGTYQCDPIAVFDLACGPDQQAYTIVLPRHIADHYPEIVASHSLLRREHKEKE
jgi:hypothetical protein